MTTNNVTTARKTYAAALKKAQQAAAKAETATTKLNEAMEDIQGEEGRTDAKLQFRMKNIAAHLDPDYVGEGGAGFNLKTSLKFANQALKLADKIEKLAREASTAVGFSYRMIDEANKAKLALDAAEKVDKATQKAAKAGKKLEEIPSSEG